MKGQICVDGQKQRIKLVPGNATSPTVYKESILIMATIDAHKGRDVMICNIPGAFISADIDEDVKMALSVRLARLMVNIAPQIYRQHMIYENGSLVLYVTLNKSLYGFLRLKLLFYEQLVADIKVKFF